MGVDLEAAIQFAAIHESEPYSNAAMDFKAAEYIRALADELRSAREQLETLKQEVAHPGATSAMRLFKSEIGRLEAEKKLATAREALEFYASLTSIDYGPALADRARAALKRMEGAEE